MYNRIDQTFSKLRAKNQKAFMVYITGGDPSPGRSVDVALALVQVGIDFLEIGIPFSDPLADGVANQLGAQRALGAGTNVPKILGIVSAIREKCEIPIILYSYLNPLYSYGLERFESDASAAGADGLLLLDLPPEETFLPDGTALHRIRLVAPTTSVDRMKRIASKASGFIYYVSQEGVTGERSELAKTIGERVAAIRSVTDLPVAVGFGISTPDQAAQVAKVADAVVVGSAIVRRIGEFANEPDLLKRIQDFVRPLVEAVKGRSQEPEFKS
jgi:tryptophan synthase alpha chain